MPKRGTPSRSRAGATPLRNMLIARRDRDMERWRIPCHVYPVRESR